MLLSGKTVLLTGATGGLGHAIARRLHQAGAQLILTGRRADVLDALTQEIGATRLAVDLADRDAVDRLAEECSDVDLLVANAALPASGTLSSFSPAELDRALDVNLRAPMVLARVLGERMAARRTGHLVFISSLSGKTATPGTSVYAATKFGLRGLGQGLRADLRPHGVGVSVIFPGFVSGAGMFADANITLPRGVGTSTPQQVADAVADAVEQNRGEVDVAPSPMRLAAAIAGVAPELSAKLSRKAGSDRIAEQMAENQAAKR